MASPQQTDDPRRWSLPLPDAPSTWLCPCDAGMLGCPRLRPTLPSESRGLLLVASRIAGASDLHSLDITQLRPRDEGRETGMAAIVGLIGHTRDPLMTRLTSDNCSAVGPTLLPC